MMLRSLPSSYSSFVTSLENRPQEDLTMDLVVARLRDEYQKRAGLGDNSESALRAFDRGRSEKKCFYCSKPGHFKKNCRKFLAEKGGESASDSRKSAGSNQLVKQKAKQAQAENGGADRSKQVVADSLVCGVVCFIAGDVIPGAWTIDSGCTCHMTNDRGFFVELKHGVKEEASALPEMQREDQHVPDDSAAESEETPVVVYEHSEDDEMQPEEHRSVYEDAEDTIESDFPDIEELSGELELPDEPVLNRQDRRTRGVLPNRYEDYIVGQVLHGENRMTFVML
nr:uncharacterized protein LOC115259989 [Aedes albopictus]